MFGPIGMQELIIIFVIALIIFGPRKLPQLGKSLGKSLAEFKRASNDLKHTLEQEIHIEETKQEILEPIETLRKDTQSSSVPIKPAPEDGDSDANSLPNLPFETINNESKATSSASATVAQNSDTNNTLVNNEPIEPT